MKVTFVSWNILNDWAVPKHAKQVDRLIELCAEINKIRQLSERIIVFLCECETRKNVDLIARYTNLVVLSQPIISRERKELCVFLADKQTARQSIAERVVIDNEPNTLIKLDFAGTSIVGCHMSAEIFRKRKLRHSFTQKICTLFPDVCMGDFNALPFFPMRRRLVRAGYLEAHKAERPLFPTPGSRHTSNPWYTPSMNIDVLYHLSNVLVVKSGYRYTNASDHPVLWAECSV
jgi:hypothetical protein